MSLQLKIEGCRALLEQVLRVIIKTKQQPVSRFLKFMVISKRFRCCAQFRFFTTYRLVMREWSRKTAVVALSVSRPIKDDSILKQRDLNHSTILNLFILLQLPMIEILIDGSPNCTARLKLNFYKKLFRKTSGAISLVSRRSMSRFIPLLCQFASRISNLDIQGSELSHSLRLPKMELDTCKIRAARSIGDLQRVVDRQIVKKLYVFFSDQFEFSDEDEISTLNPHVEKLELFTNCRILLQKIRLRFINNVRVYFPKICRLHIRYSGNSGWYFTGNSCITSMAQRIQTEYDQALSLKSKCDETPITTSIDFHYTSILFYVSGSNFDWVGALKRGTNLNVEYHNNLAILTPNEAVAGKNFSCVFKIHGS